ncbi:MULTISPECIES: cardiolipin synthase [unclassified Sporosarcina]|uniref:cardiolipin synthase n=1 Tax=unclassified Sporosarcina TaxID=2647733 RepID=UPI002040D956|nr:MULTISPECIES: cardiolipin synthase [unclassified Sporosarcina]GKV66529.1 major cardiolipin synthase ClsA [Sporosarcina sp. NCCP-2331]GLB56806.1 major cardiolipin synthase ClsA [Sporosarcina sp. NCCP-2378]
MDITNFITLSVSIITALNVLLLAGVLFFERRDVGNTWAWIMVLVFLPIAGFFIYLFLGRNLKQKNFYKLTAEEKEAIETEADRQLETLDNEQLAQSPLMHKHKELIRMNLMSSHALLSDDNAIRIFTDGHEKFDALLADIKSAEQEVNIQYYIIQPDALGKRIRDALIERAKAGVKVRLLYDEVGSKKTAPKFFEDLRKAGGKVEVFFPSLFRLVNFRVNNRNHRKLVIIDGRIGYIGGFNIGDEYLGLNEKFGYWRDTHLRITGKAVNNIQGKFILDWHQAGKNKPGVWGDYSFQQKVQNGTSPVQIVSSGPDSVTEHLKNMYIKLILSAKESIFIQTPYFIPDTSFMDACKIALLSGVDVRIMIPCKPDHPFVYWATWAYAGDLIDYGAKILLYENGFLHAKTIVVDGEVASVGTMNIDSRSFRLNFEVNAIIYDEQVAKQLQNLFLQDIELSSELTAGRYAERSLWIRFKQGISRLLSPVL